MHRCRYIHVWQTQEHGELEIVFLENGRDISYCFDARTHRHPYQAQLRARIGHCPAVGHRQWARHADTIGERYPCAFASL
jgi:hypothetical protein